MYSGSIADKTTNLPQGKQKFAKNNFTWNDNLYMDISCMNEHDTNMALENNLIEESWIFLVGPFEISSNKVTYFMTMLSNKLTTSFSQHCLL